MKGRAFGAVVAGFLFIVVVTTLVDLLLHALGVFPGAGQPLDDRLALLATSYRIVISVAGAWLTARLAPANPMTHALVLGAIGTFLGLVGVVVTWNMNLGPRWYPIALMVLAIPQCWAGGKLYERLRRPGGDNSVSRSTAVFAVLILMSSLLAAGAPATPPAGQAQDAHHAAAEELLRLLQLDTMTDQMIDTMLKAQTQQNPDLAQFQDVMRAFLTKYISYNALKPDLVKLYADAFTEKELREITTFYRTQTGKKCIDVMPALIQKGAALGGQRVMEHMDELKAAIDSSVKEPQN
jgi:hypothetical protein